MTRIGFVADDFTGATDALWQYQRAGLSTILVCDPAVIGRRMSDVRSADVVGIATVARAVPSRELPEVVDPAFAALAACDVAVAQYKVCSTFDSAPDRGSIGAVIDRVLDSGRFSGPVAVVPAQPELGRYTVFGNHFARHSSSMYRLDRHPTMRQHPATPMTEADLRIHLRHQTRRRVGSMPAPFLAAGEAIAAVGSMTSEEIYVADVVHESDLDTVAEAILAISSQHRVLLVGAGGISGAIGRRCTRRGPWSAPPIAATAKPVLAVSGSRSPLTNQQLEVAAANGWTLLDFFAAPVPELVRRVRESLALGVDTIVYTARGDRATGIVTDRIGEQLAELLRVGIDDLAGRIVVAGGDTSGACLRALGVEALRIVAAHDTGNVVCRAYSRDAAVDGLEIGLKGGQMGSAGYFLEVAGRAGVPPVASSSDAGYAVGS